VFLSGVGVSTSLAVRIYKKYAGASITIVTNEPYRLASDLWGIGFKTADRPPGAATPGFVDGDELLDMHVVQEDEDIAQAVGIPHDSPARIGASEQVSILSRSRTSTPIRRAPGRCRSA